TVSCRHSTPRLISRSSERSAYRQERQLRSSITQPQIIRASGSTAKAAQPGPARMPGTSPVARVSSPSHTTSNSRRTRNSPGGRPVHTGSASATPVAGSSPRVAVPAGSAVAVVPAVPAVTIVVSATASAVVSATAPAAAPAAASAVASCAARAAVSACGSACTAVSVCVSVCVSVSACASVCVSAEVPAVRRSCGLPVSRGPAYVGETEPMTPTTETMVGIGGAAESTDMVLNIGPQHPSTHGVLRLKLVLDGELISRAEPVIGYMHRGAEKLFEARDYRQIIVLANRHDWLSAFSNELGVVLAVERMLGMEVPERAVWLRTLLAELNRVLNHLMFLGSYPLELGGITPIFYAFREREELQHVMEEVSGGRMHYMFNRVGGLKEDLPAGWTTRARAAVADVRSRMGRFDDLVLGNEIFRGRTRDVGVLSPEAVHAYGVSGPIARASGVDFDLRRDEPYLAYGELGDVLKVVTREEGDCLARFECLLEQTYNA